MRGFFHQRSLTLEIFMMMAIMNAIFVVPVQCCLCNLEFSHRSPDKTLFTLYQ